MAERVASTQQHADDQDDWAWRRKIRSNPKSNQIYRLCVGVAGLIVVIVGIILLPFPGPGWVVIFIGLGVWASEFEWAQNLLHWVRRKVQAWWDWIEAKGWWAKLLAGLATFLLVMAIFWAMFAISGIPGWMPQFAKDLLTKVPGLA